MPVHQGMRGHDDIRPEHLQFEGDILDQVLPGQGLARLVPPQGVLVRREISGVGGGDGIKEDKLRYRTAWRVLGSK